jgi:hypothetical protein
MGMMLVKEHEHLLKPFTSGGVDPVWWTRILL